MLYLPPLMTTSELQLTYSSTIVGNLLKSRWAEVFQLGTYRREHLETGRRGGDTEWVDLTPRCGSWDTGRLFRLQKYPQRSERSKIPHPDSHPRVPVSEKEKSPQPRAVKTMWKLRWVRQKAAGVPGVTLKRSAHELTHWLTQLVLSFSSWVAA